MRRFSAQKNYEHQRRLSRRFAVVRRDGFSMVELLVVLAVVVLLMSLLMPAIATVKENARRLVCSSNLRQMGFATAAYAGDFDGKLPTAAVLDEASTEVNRAMELMASHRGERRDQWDGLGLLYKSGYCAQPQCFYCPSHHGDHAYEEYADEWRERLDMSDGNLVVKDKIYMNYHYGGDRAWNDDHQQYRRRLHDTRKGKPLVLATDGLRSVQDFNHDVGLNVLLADGSVNWFNSGPRIRPYLPTIDEEDSTVTAGELAYIELWSIIEDLIN